MDSDWSPSDRLSIWPFPVRVGGESERKEREMSRVVVNNNITLDGVMQAPGHPDEDRRGGFEHGGWAAPYFDEVMGQWASKGIAKGGALLFGRRTYEKMERAWADGPEDSPFTKVMNTRQKYVASTTLEAPLEWQNSTLLEGDAADAVAKLKSASGPDVVVLGSGDLVQSLMRRNLIDEYVLLIHPLTLGSGLRLFPEGSPDGALKLVDSTPTTTGVIIATYHPC
jgi:dihydrofolate reductase